MKKTEFTAVREEDPNSHDGKKNAIRALNLRFSYRSGDNNGAQSKIVIQTVLFILSGVVVCGIAYVSYVTST